jgi:hypothetical protein
MTIDLILDRKNGKKYNSKEFYNKIMLYYQFFPEIVEPIANALDSGDEQDVKNALCSYIMTQDYNPQICEYINSVNWL